MVRGQRIRPGVASREVDRQKLRETINQLQPFQGRPRTFGQLCQDYIENELRIDQSQSARPKAFPTIETYERHLINRIIPRWGRLAPLEVESRDVEAWFRELRKGNVQKKEKPLADPTIDKIRRIMSLVYKHGQRHNYVPRQQEGNPMNWVSQRTTSDYRALIMTPKQAFEVLLNIPEPRRTLTLSDAATALRIARIDVDGSRFRRVGNVRSASLCVGKVQATKVESFEGAGSHASVIGGIHARMARKDALSQRQRLRVSERKAGRQEASLSIHHGAEIPETRRCQTWCDCDGLEGSFRVSQLPALTRNGDGEAESRP
jgi:hypothetical protein